MNVLLITPQQTNVLMQKSVNFFCKGLENKYLWMMVLFCG